MFFGRSRLYRCFGETDERGSRVVENVSLEVITAAGAHNKQDVSH